MNLKKSQADIFYRELRTNQEQIEEAAEAFLDKEAVSIMNIEALISQCKDDKSYEFNFPLMEQNINNIRTTKLALIRDQYGLLDFKKRKYFKRLLTELGYM